MFHDQLEVLVRVVGRQFDQLGRRCHIAEPPRIVEGGVHVGIDQFDRLGAIVLGWSCGYRELPFERVAACVPFARSAARPVGKAGRQIRAGKPVCTIGRGRDVDLQVFQYPGCGNPTTWRQPR